MKDTHGPVEVQPSSKPGTVGENRLRGASEIPSRLGRLTVGFEVISTATWKTRPPGGTVEEDSARWARVKKRSVSRCIFAKRGKKIKGCEFR